MEYSMKFRLSAFTIIFSSLGLIACGGTGTDHSVIPAPAPAQPNTTAQGMWQGTTGSDRAISGVVTDQGDYWLSYTQVADHSIPAGFYTGQGVSDGGDFTEAKVLREFSFEGGGAMQGNLTSATYTLSVGYSAANALAGSFAPVSVSNVYDVTMSGSVYFAKAAGNVDFTYTGTMNGANNTGIITGSIYVEPYALTVDTSNAFSINPVTGKGTLNGASSCNDHGSGTCASFSPIFKGPVWNGINWAGQPSGSTATPFAVAAGDYQWSIIIVTDQDDDFNNVYDTIPLTVHLEPQSLPSITADNFTSTYDMEFENTPSLSAIGGSYTAGFTGIDSTMHTDASLTISGATITGTEAASYCNYTATIAPHSSGNVYDVTNIVFTDAAGGSCVYTGVTFTGVATYEASGKLTLTAVDTSRGKGFMVVATH
jgi:hypothetical protein